MEARDQRYEDVMNHVYETYGSTILIKLKALRATLIENGFAITKPYDNAADEYRWSMQAWAPGKEANDPEQGFDISINVSEQRVYDGDEDAKGDAIFGLNFSLDVVEYGGEIIGGLAPFNYTDECWVDAREVKAVEDRWEIIYLTDDQETANFILDHFKQKEEKE